MRFKKSIMLMAVLMILSISSAMAAPNFIVF